MTHALLHGSYIHLIFFFFNNSWSFSLSIWILIL
jgi:hypothetical protein